MLRTRGILDLMPVSPIDGARSRGRERPLIAVTTSEMRDPPEHLTKDQADPPRREMALGLRYLEAIESSGGVPVVAPPMGLVAAEALLDAVDGLCLSGGPDIHPSAYGQEPHPELGPTERELDAFELALVRAADARSLPVLAVCRGAQLVNVARGGTLIQHLPDVVGDQIEHRQRERAENLTHAMRLEPGSLLSEIAGWHDGAVNSFHHQAVDELGYGLTATGWAPDGTIEAFEAPDRPFLIGVQWHAECLIGWPEHVRLFQAFVAACRVGGGDPRARATEPVGG
ncbi:gamma-glutamyl-gamma-aminobutyrate hydrolase family protein [Conexibacter sp. CPCC 206217]|uniref:gamma-glutamyl-gamma-aminobutyrate hydrolase family protein n=1 Tax=Conexibacter sp. CPCC 206217 TaxID=3064574 RepID=UPI00271E8DC0|nr:gamma-glutamyl-gamma-aminobutyrate hydrolase family protein [Conexibacter sp. CPCC 206217]MDO8213340.1 gamma-glutamyl-gamma-aminobutyrate hydrolase family protein [Conexibacter sp. CPCC 206217]